MNGLDVARVALCCVLDQLAAVQESLGLPSIRPATGPFFDRPFTGVRPIAGLVLASIDDVALRHVAFTYSATL